MAKVEPKRELKPVVVTTLDEIRGALRSVLADTPTREVNVTTEIRWQEDQERGVDKVTGKSVDSTLGSVLISGMDIVKQRIDAYEKMKAASNAMALDLDNSDIQNNLTIWDIDKIRFNVDTLIRNRLGGRRIGLRIRWDVREGIFEYDPYLKKLYKVEN